MKRKFGIKRTKMNIFWLFLIGLLIGIVFGLRQPIPSQITETVNVQQATQEVQK